MSSFVTHALISVFVTAGALLAYDRLVVKPFIFTTLKVMRRPAKLAGLQDLQSFLEHGFEAFRHMGGADEFLATIGGRETRILSRLFSGHPDPFSG